MNTTADRVIDALADYQLKDEGNGQYRADCPWRAGSDSQGLSIKIEDGEHGAYTDHVSGESGSLYDLAERLGIELVTSAYGEPASTKRKYTDLKDYAQAHGVTSDVFKVAGWHDAGMYQGRQALIFTTDTGIKYRFIDGEKPTFKPKERGYQACWYKLTEAVILAERHSQPLVICNGEPSTIVAQYFGVAATATTGGENKTINSTLLDALKAAYHGPILVALDCDNAGNEGAYKWYEALSSAGYDVRALDLNGGKGFDLADFCHLHQHGSTAALPKLADLVMNAPQDVTTIVEQSVVVPPLPAYAALDPALAATASPWLDSYIAFSRTWSPESYDGFHEAIGLWVLSTVAARRVAVDYGAEHYTNLYIALCARSTVFAKTTAANIGRSVLSECGLEYLIAPDDATPQAFLRSLTVRVPDGFSQLDDVRRAAIQRRLAFVAQKGWFYDEFGQKLHAMMQSAGAMVEYRGHLRRLDDYPPTYEYATVGRGSDLIERPYLALLASLTPADLQPHARKGAALWGDGFLARFALVAPPLDLHIPCQDFPEGQRIIPLSIVQPLQQWHHRLGIPNVSIVERLNDKGEATGVFDATVESLSPNRCTLGADVRQAINTYRRALRELRQAKGTDDTDLDGNYGRLHITALRIAMLLASLENGGQVELRHWARAQEIAERWRANVHYLVAQLATRESTKAQGLEDRILMYLGKGKLTVRELKQNTHASYADVEAALAVLLQRKQVRAIKTRQTTYYELVGANESVAPTNTSAPPATPATPATPIADNQPEHVASVARSTCSTDGDSSYSPSRNEETTPSDVIPDTTKIDIEYVRRMLQSGNEQAIRVHCALRRVSYDDAIQVVTS
jgi:hypothetical protein